MLNFLVFAGKLVEESRDVVTDLTCKITQYKRVGEGLGEFMLDNNI